MKSFLKLMFVGAALLITTSEPALSQTSKAITLPEVVALTLQHNKELDAYSWELRAQEAKIIQAGFMPNPTLEIQPENIVGNKFFRNQFQNTIQINQLIELGDKRSKRVLLAEMEKDKELTQYEIKKNDVLSEANLRFIEVLCDEEALRLARRGRMLAEGTLRDVRKRLKAGGSPGIEEPKTRVLVARTVIEEEHSEHELNSSKINLSALWNEEHPHFEIIKGDLFQEIQIPDLEALYQQVDSSPRALQLRSEERLRKAVLGLEQARRIPDVNFGVGWRYGRNLDDQTMVASVSVPLQIFDRNQGAIAQAEALSRKSQSESEGLPVRIKAAVFEVYQELVHARTELQLMKSEIIPQSEKALSVVEDGYRQGRYSLMELSDAQRTLIENSASRIKAAGNFNKLSIELTRLLGGPINGN